MQTTSATTARPRGDIDAVSATGRDDPALSYAFRAADGAPCCAAEGPPCQPRTRLQPLPHTVAASAAYGCRLGVGASWAFSDCVGLEEEALRSVPQPCVGCIFLYPFRRVVSRRGRRH